MKIGVWILVMVGMGGTPLAHAGSTFSSGETPQVSAHLDFQITIQPSLKVQLDLQDKRLQAQAETSPGSTLLRQADDQLSEHHERDRTSLTPPSGEGCTLEDGTAHFCA